MLYKMIILILLMSGHERENVGQNQLGHEKKPFSKGLNNNMAESMRFELMVA